MKWQRLAAATLLLSLWATSSEAQHTMAPTESCTEPGIEMMMGDGTIVEMPDGTGAFPQNTGTTFEINDLMDNGGMDNVGMDNVGMGAAGMGAAGMGAAGMESESAAEEEEDEEEEEEDPYKLDFKSGFLISPTDVEKTPFELRINGRMQFRYAGFSREADTFTNQTGTIDVESRSGFEIERARLEFRGFFYDPRLRYYFNIDADTDDNHDAIFHDFWVSYRFSDLFNVLVGKSKVPASYEWRESSTTTRFADRSVSTTFFRADRSTGVWFDGKSDVRNFAYEVGIVNGFQATDLDQGDIDDVLSYAGLVQWDPLGDYGKGYSDLDYTPFPLIRLGATGAYSNQNPFGDGSNTDEPGFARLSDGTSLTATGALAPGLTVNDFDLYLISAFINGKYRGWSYNIEGYARWLQDIETIEGPTAPITQLFDSGFYADFGYMIIPSRLELNGRVSQVSGLFGDSWEYATGWNWFFDGSHKHKLTFDATFLDGSPAASSSPNFEIGQDGTLYRLQYQAAF